MTIIDELLKIDAGEVTVPTGNFKMKLSKLKGKEFTLPIKGLSPEFVNELQEELLDIRYNTKKKDISLGQGFAQQKYRRITEGCPTVFKDKDLLNHFHAHTPHDLINKLLTPGEMDALVDAINELTGFDADGEIEEEVKN